MKIREGFKYVVDEEARFLLPKWFPYQLRSHYEDTRIKVDSESLTLKQGFAWNGANAFPDHDWVIVPSAIHDAMLWWRHYYWVDKPQDNFEELRDREMKRAIDRWFADECKARIPRWRKFTPTFMFFGVNVLSKIAPGKNQAEAHEVKEYY